MTRVLTLKGHVPLAPEGFTAEQYRPTRKASNLFAQAISVAIESCYYFTRTKFPVVDDRAMYKEELVSVDGVYKLHVTNRGYNTIPGDWGDDENFHWGRTDLIIIELYKSSQLLKTVAVSHSYNLTVVSCELFTFIYPQDRVHKEESEITFMLQQSTEVVTPFYDERYKRGALTMSGRALRFEPLSVIEDETKLPVVVLDENFTDVLYPVVGLYTGQDVYTYPMLDAVPDFLYAVMDGPREGGIYADQYSMYFIPKSLKTFVFRFPDIPHIEHIDV